MNKGWFRNWRNGIGERTSGLIPAHRDTIVVTCYYVKSKLGSENFQKNHVATAALCQTCLIKKRPSFFFDDGVSPIASWLRCAFVHAFNFRIIESPSIRKHAVHLRCTNGDFFRRLMSWTTKQMRRGLFRVVLKSHVKFHTFVCETMQLGFVTLFHADFKKIIL